MHSNAHNVLSGEEREIVTKKDEIIEMIKQADLRRLKLIYQYIKALMA